MDHTNPFQGINEQLLEIKHALNTLIDQQPLTSTKKDSGLIDRKELGRRIGLSDLTLRRYAEKGIIKEIRIGSAVRFDYEQVLSDLRKSKTTRHGK